MKLRPLYDKVVVRKEKQDQVTEGGIHLPESVVGEKETIAVIVAVGEGRLTSRGDTIALRVEPGQRVVIGNFVGTDVNLGDDEKYTLIREDDILGVLEE